MEIPMIVVWGVLTLVFAIVEAATLGLATIWFAGGAFVALIFALFDFSIAVQIGVFITISILLLVFARKIFVDKLKTGQAKTNVETMPGKTGKCVSEISGFDGGRVLVSGLEWAARSEDEIIDPGQWVRIKRVEGVTLLVERVENMQVNSEEEKIKFEEE